MRKTELVNIRVTKEEKEILLNKSKEGNFRSISEFLRIIGLNYDNDWMKKK